MYSASTNKAYYAINQSINHFTNILLIVSYYDSSTRLFFIGGFSSSTAAAAAAATGAASAVLLPLPFSVPGGGRFRFCCASWGGKIPRCTDCSISSISAGLEALATNSLICSFSSGVKLVVKEASAERPSPGTKVLCDDECCSPCTSASRAAPAALLANRSARSRSVFEILM